MRTVESLADRKLLFRAFGLALFAQNLAQLVMQR
jgi:hypothetical protein